MKWIVVVLSTLSVLSLSVGYSPNVSVAASFGAAIGGYIGENLAVPTLILLSKFGIVDEGELFSPFSTLMYDSMDTGFVIGAFIGGTALSLIVNPSIGNAALESLACLAVLNVRNPDVKRSLSIVVSSILGGIVW